MVEFYKVFLSLVGILLVSLISRGLWVRGERVRQTRGLLRLLVRRRRRIWLVVDDCEPLAVPLWLPGDGGSSSGR